MKDTIKYQIIKWNVAEANEQVTVNVNTDKLYKNITGLVLTLPYNVLPADRAEIQLVINDQEIFPENFEAKLIVSDLSIPVNERLYKIEEEADGSTVKIKYKDGGMPDMQYPYEVRLYLKLEERI